MLMATLLDPIYLNFVAAATAFGRASDNDMTLISESQVTPQQSKKRQNKPNAHLLAST